MTQRSNSEEKSRQDNSLPDSETYATVLIKDEKALDTGKTYDRNNESSHRRRVKKPFSQNSTGAKIWKKNNLFADIEGEDLEYRVAPLSPSEIYDYVSMPLLHKETKHKGKSNYQPEIEGLDNCKGRVLIPKTNLSTDSWKEEIYEECIIDGKFERVLYKLDEAGRRIESFNKKKHALETPEHDANILFDIKNQLNAILEGWFLIFQGLFVGCTLLQMLFTVLVKNRCFFVGIYLILMPVFRPLIFGFSIFSVLGPVIVLKNEDEIWWNQRDAHERAQIWLSGLLFLAAYALTLAMWPIVDQISDGQNVSETEQLQMCLDNENFQKTSDIRMWSTLAIIRFSCALLAWLIACKFIGKDQTKARATVIVLDNCKKVLDACCSQNGLISKRLDSGAPTPELRQHLQISALYLQRAREEIEERGG